MGTETVGAEGAAFKFCHETCCGGDADQGCTLKNRSMPRGDEGVAGWRGKECFQEWKDELTQQIPDDEEEKDAPNWPKAFAVEEDAGGGGWLRRRGGQRSVRSGVGFPRGGLSGIHLKYKCIGPDLQIERERQRAPDVGSA